MGQQNRSASNVSRYDGNLCDTQKKLIYDQHLSSWAKEAQPPHTHNSQKKHNEWNLWQILHKWKTKRL